MRKFEQPDENLKSSLDRFIDALFITSTLLIKYLKSSLDRFIEHCQLFRKQIFSYLKSSLDRFIDILTSCNILFVVI